MSPNSVRPANCFLIGGAVSYLDFEYANLAPNTGLALGFVSPSTPEWKWSLGPQ